MVKRNKGQMKIQQMAFMLIAIFIFFALVGLLIITVKFSGLKEKATELQEKNAMLLVAKIANSPEFSCGDAFGGSRVSCIDLDKVMVLKENIGTYEGFWGRGVSNIEIIKIYPAPQNKKNLIECRTQDYSNCDKISLISEEIVGVAHSNFVALCRKESYNGQIYDKCDLGQILVSYEVVQ